MFSSWNAWFTVLLIFAVPFRYSLFLFPSRPFVLVVHRHKISGKIKRLSWTSSPLALNPPKYWKCFDCFPGIEDHLLRHVVSQEIAPSKTCQIIKATKLTLLRLSGVLQFVNTAVYILSGCTPLPAMTHCHFQNIKDDVYCFICETLQVSRLWVTSSPIELSWTSNKKNIKNVILSFSCGMFFLRWMSGIVILFAF